MNILFLVGLAIFLGTVCGKVFEKLKFPQVVGYIILGLIVGKSFLHVLEGEVLHSLAPLINFTLGIIGCVIGSELKGPVFKKFGRSIYTILLSEGLLAFFFVTVTVTLLTQKLYLGLILGAIASATDPASTVNVLWQYKSKGPLTRTVTSIIALDDALALMIYGLVSVFTKTMILEQTFSWWEGFGVPILQIVECLALGAISAIIVVQVCKFIKEEALVISFIMGVIAAGVGLSMSLGLDLILSSMAFGATMANMLPKMSEKIFGLIKEMTTSLYILFFIAIGAELDIRIFLNVAILGIVIAYLISRSVGKIFGAWFGSKITGADKNVTKYTGLCLFTQGGVAMGLALSMSHNLAQTGAEGQQVGVLIINVVAATTFVVQLIGPSLVKYSITKADERGRNVTKEDIIESLTVKDVMKKDFKSIQEGEHLNGVIQIVKDEDAFNFPVVDTKGSLFGVITVKELKDALFEGDLNDLVLAEDIAIPAYFTVYPQQPLAEIFDLFNKRSLDFLPVLESLDSKKVVGIVEYRYLKEDIDKRLLSKHGGED